MKVAIYPGSFNPWHTGHQDIYDKALQVFDKVIVAVAENPEKPGGPDPKGFPTNIQVENFQGLLADYVKVHPENPVAVVRGLRNGTDLEYEKVQQYWNEDLGLKIPIVFFLTDRSQVHLSSSAIRAVAKIHGRRS